MLGAAGTALLVVLIAVSVGWRVYRGDGSLLRDVSISETRITPNADGDNDAAQFNYEISRNAAVSIYFENAGGERFYFRRARERGAGEYAVLFSGVVEGYRLETDLLEGKILDRLLQNGAYTWVIEATDADGVIEQSSGSLTIAGADTTLPELRNFSLDRTYFTPNQDGIDDRVLIQYQLVKTATVQVYIELVDGTRLPIPEAERDIPAGFPGRHYYDYEGGVDNKATPPPDGIYPIVAIAEDREGQKVRVSTEVEIEYGGVPLADIVSPAVGDTVQFSATSVTLCDTIVFTLTVNNYSATPIRTTGPEPGTVYDSDWNYNTIGWPTESGAWRVAIGYENEIFNYPFRWAIGNRSDLTEIDGRYYLMPGQRATVSGAIRIVAPLGERNPQPVWAGLIHEDVEISQFNNRVDAKQVLIGIPEPDSIGSCPARPVPQRAEN